MSEFHSSVASVTRTSIQPRDGDGTAEVALRVFNCHIADADANSTRTDFGADSGKGLFFHNIIREAYVGDCVLVVDD